MINKCTQIIACAGSGKTTSLLKSAYKCAKQQKYKSSVLILTYSRNSKNDFCKRLIQSGYSEYISLDQILTIHSISQTINNKIEIQQQIQDQYIEFSILKSTNYIKSHPDECRQIFKLKCVKYLFIDEAQDLSEIQFNFIHSLVFLLNCDVFFVGDPCQCIYQFQGAQTHLMYKIPYLFQDQQIESKLLSINYRSQKKIVDLANIIRPDKSSCGNLQLSQLTPKLFLQPKYKYLQAVINKIQESAKLIDGRLCYNHIAVIGPVKCSKSTNLGLQQIRNRLTEMKIPIQVQYALDDEGSSNKLQTNGQGLNLLTIHSSKGLEFDTVILIDFHFQLMNKSPSIQEYQEIHKNLIYVAITRAKYDLSIFAIFNKISPLFHDIHQDVQIIISPDCIIKGVQITNVNQLLEINIPNYNTAQNKDNNTVTELVKHMTVNQSGKNIQIQTILMNTLQTAIQSTQIHEKIETQQSLQDYNIPFGLTAEHIANFSVIGPSYITKLQADFSNQIHIQITYDFNRSFIILKSLQEFQLQILQQSIKLKDQDIAKIEYILQNNQTVKLTKSAFNHTNTAIEKLLNADIDNIYNIYQAFFEISIAEFVEAKSADHIYSEDYMTQFQNEFQNLSLIPSKIQWIQSPQIYVQVPIYSQNLRIYGIIDMISDNYIIEFKYKNSLGISDFLQLLIYGLIHDPQNTKKRALINLKTGETKIINLSTIIDFNRTLLIAILEMSQRCLYDSILMYHFNTLNNTCPSNINNQSIIDRYIYDWNFKFSISEGSIKQDLNGNIIENCQIFSSDSQLINRFQTDLQMIKKMYNNPIFVTYSPLSKFDNELIQKYFKSCIINFPYRITNSLRIFKSTENKIIADSIEDTYKQELGSKNNVIMLIKLYDSMILCIDPIQYLMTNSQQYFV